MASFRMTAPPPSYPFGLPVGVDEGEWGRQWRQWEAEQGARDAEAREAYIVSFRRGALHMLDGPADEEEMWSGVDAEDPPEALPPAVLTDLKKAIAPLRAYYDGLAEPIPVEWSTVPNLTRPLNNITKWNTSVFAWLFTKKSNSLFVQTRLFNREYTGNIFYYNHVEKIDLQGNETGTEWKVRIATKRADGARGKMVYEFVSEENATAFFMALSDALNE